MTHDEIGAYVAEQYQTLVSEHDDILVTENFCNVKIFYKQRVFEYLLGQNGNFTTPNRQNYLIALVHLLEQVPEDLLFLHLTKVRSLSPQIIRDKKKKKEMYISRDIRV